MGIIFWAELEFFCKSCFCLYFSIKWTERCGSFTAIKMAINLVLQELYCSSVLHCWKWCWNITESESIVAAASLLKPCHTACMWLQNEEGVLTITRSMVTIITWMWPSFSYRKVKNLCWYLKKEREKISYCLEGANGELCLGSYGISGEENSLRKIRLRVPFSCSQDV